MSRWVFILSYRRTVRVHFFFLLFHSFLSEPGGQPAGRQGCREVFSSSTWVRETDGACQTVICGFIQIYDGRRWGWMWTGRMGAVGGKEGQLSVQDSVRQKPLDGAGGGSQHAGAVVWIECFILALCVLLFCHLLRRTSLPSHWTPLHPSQDSELSFRLLDWRLPKLLLTQRHLVLFPANLACWVSPLILTIQHCQVI